MHISAKQELAIAYKRSLAIHEASYHPKRGYGRSWIEAATQGCDDRDLVPLIASMGTCGYSDFADWADKFAASEAETLGEYDFGGERTA